MHCIRAPRPNSVGARFVRTFDVGGVEGCVCCYAENGVLIAVRSAQVNRLSDFRRARGFGGGLNHSCIVGALGRLCRGALQRRAWFRADYARSDLEPVARSGPEVRLGRDVAPASRNPIQSRDQAPPLRILCPIPWAGLHLLAQGNRPAVRASWRGGFRGHALRNHPPRDFAFCLEPPFCDPGRWLPPVHGLGVLAFAGCGERRRSRPGRGIGDWASFGWQTSRTPSRSDSTQST